MNNKIKVRHKKDGSERWMTPKAFAIVKNDFVLVNDHPQQSIQEEVKVPNVPAPQNEGAAQVATEATVKRKPGPKPKLKPVTDEA